LTLNRWVTLAVVSAATAMLLLDVTIVYVALPAIGDDLGAGFSELQWVIDAYTVVMAATLLAAGSVADRVGRRAVFTGGLAIFTFFSALCGAAGSPLVLDLSRAAQGLGAAAMFAASLALLAHEFRGRERGIAFGVWGAITGASLAFGPLLGGLIIDGLGWRWIFLVNLPLGAMLIATTLTVLPESRDDRPRPPDVAGMVIFGAAVFLAVFALIRGNEDGWGSLPIAASIIGALVLFVVFVLVERRASSPMLPAAFFRIPAFSGTALVAFAQSVAIYPLLLFLAIYFQDALGLSATDTGLRLLPLTLAIFIVAPMAGRLTSRLPLRLPLVSGMLLLGCAMLVMYGVDGGDWTGLLPGLLLGGVAIGLISPALAAAMVSVLPVEQSGLSSGINNTFRQLGIAIGIAGLGAIFDNSVADSAGAVAGSSDGVNSVLLVSAAVAILAGLISWPLLGDQRSSGIDESGVVGE
jgi:EmrB/QacA subfamily drug resistance transporter